VRAYVIIVFPSTGATGRKKKWCSCVIGLRATRGAVAAKRNGFPRSSAAGSRFCSLVLVDPSPSRGSVLLSVIVRARRAFTFAPQPVGGWCDGRPFSPERVVVGEQQLPAVAVRVTGISQVGG